MIKRWSKERRLLESFFCESLKDRLQWHQAVHRHSHDQPPRYSLTLDKQEIFATNTIKVEMTRGQYDRLSESEQQNFITSLKETRDFDTLMAHYRDISFLYAESKGFYGIFSFFSISDYPNLSIEEAIHSPFELVRAYAMLDRRLGKRRLEKMDISKENEIVKQFYKIRMSSEYKQIL